MIRHKAVKATLDKGYATEWNDDHDLNPAQVIVTWTTFIEEPFSNRWDTAQSTGGGSASVVIADQHAWVEVNSGSSVGDIASIRHMLAGSVENITHPDDQPEVTMAIRLINPATTGLTHEFGFFRQDIAPFTSNQPGAYFRIEDNKVYAVTGDGTSETVTEIGGTSEYAVYRVRFLGSQVRFYIDDMTSPVAVHEANIPDDHLTVKLSTIAVSEGAQVLRSDFVGIVRLRKK